MYMYVIIYISTIQNIVLVLFMSECEWFQEDSRNSCLDIIVQGLGAVCFPNLRFLEKDVEKPSEISSCYCETVKL